MAKKTPKPFITRIQAEGTTQEKRLEREELDREAQKLASQMPTELPYRLIYIRNLTTKALRKQIDHEVFYRFLKLTNSMDLFTQVLPRARTIAEKGG